MTLSLDAESRCSEPSPAFSLKSGTKPQGSSLFHLLSVHSVGSPALGMFSSSFFCAVAYLSLRNQKYEERPTRNFVWYSAISQIFLLAGTFFLNVSHTSPLPSGNKFWIKHEHLYGHSLLSSSKAAAAAAAAAAGPFQTCFTFFFQFCVSVHHIMINKNTSFMQLISIYFTYSKSLHVSGRILPIIRRIWYCTYQRLVLVR